MLTPESVQVKRLGHRRFPSPLKYRQEMGLGDVRFSDDAKVHYQVELFQEQEDQQHILFEKAGPRETLYFNPSETKAAIVTCGGLCPGLNNVIRSLVNELALNYGVREVLGIRYGYRGLNPAKSKPPILLDPELVSGIHNDGGTILGTSRGAEDPVVIVDYLQEEGINILFCVGGDGTQRGAHKIYEEVERRGAFISIVGIPKTIDNDIPFVYRTFGLSTAVEQAREVIQAAHTEAKSVENGIGLVKVMGREAGFIACGTTIASGEVNYTLIPEIPLRLEGENGFLEVLKRRMLNRGHAVILVAEGAGQHLLGGPHEERDASGNVVFRDIGPYLRDQISAYFKREGIPVGMKYIDPSYAIRGVPANTDDSLLCDNYARYAAHAGMAGKTDVLIGLWYNVFIHIPIPLTLMGKKQVSPESALWMGVLASTGQPARFE